MATKTASPKGTRDFLPAETVKRNYIFDQIKQVFQRYGFLPIETPAMENLSTLTGKYGDEGDKLLFKILNSGDFLSKVKDDAFSSKDSSKLTKQISEKGLRYDLTVPFARFVVQHQNELSFPFKRYQIQPVWRADRPQKGRYREFFQCDVDIIGSDALLNEFELIQIIDDVFQALKISTCIKLNNRKILAGIAQYAEAPEALIEITVAIDKIEKIGIEKVKEELSKSGIKQTSIEKLIPILEMQGSSEEKIHFLKQRFTQSDCQEGLTGLAELEEVFDYCKAFSFHSIIELDLTLARGLSYYTGMILEVKALDHEMGSICGGGRYDNLTGVFGLKGISGVGISFGADRIYDVLKELELFPKAIDQLPQILFVNFGKQEATYCLKALRQLRNHNINAEIYPDQAKMKKQMSYANKKEIPFVALAGEEEIKNNVFTFKNMNTGEQSTKTLNEIIEKLKP